MTDGGVDALLFDLGRVVIDIDFDRALAHWAKHAACDAAVLRERFSHDDAFKRHEVGALSDTAYFASLQNTLGIELPDTVWLEGWNAIFVGEIPGISLLLHRAAAQVPIYAFSNSNPAHEACWTRQFAGVLGHFTDVYVSSTIGCRKPEAEAFAYVAKAMDVHTHRIVFFDDNLENIAGAQHCGLQAVHVTSSADVARALDRLGL